MPTLKLPGLLLSLLLAAPACLARNPDPAPVQVGITLRQDAALEVRYTLPPSCPGLAFANDDIKPVTAAAIRADWTPLDDCTVLDAQGVRPRDATCTALRLRVPATMRAQDAAVYDRIYPWAQPVGEGLYVHTSAYAVTPSCGAVGWTFAAPGGTVVLDGVAGAQQAASGAPQAGYMPALLIARPYDRQAAPLLLDANVTPAVRAFMEQTLAQSRGELQAMLPDAVFKPAYVVARAAEMSHWRSDVANGTTLRVSLPLALTPDAELRSRGLIAHELAHFLQPGPVTGDWGDERAAVMEGGAEFLRLAVLARRGWITPARLQDEMEMALNDCLMQVGGTSWAASPVRGWGMAPYRCGLALHLLGLANGQGEATALQRLNDYYRAARGGAQDDFARALECGRDAACTPRWLPRVRGSEALAAIVADWRRMPASLVNETPAWGPSLTRAVADWHLGQLMAADCGGTVSIYMEPGQARIGQVATCRTLRENMVVLALEGAPLYGDAAAVRASLQACRERGATVLGLEGGKTLTVACNAATLSTPVFGIDPVRAQALFR